ncbi:MAG TPA: hypothetical protein VIJ11_00925 [Galbitalea sp.]
MYKSLVVVAVALAGIFAAPLAMLDDLHSTAPQASAAYSAAAPESARTISDAQLSVPGAPTVLAPAPVTQGNIQPAHASGGVPQQLVFVWSLLGFLALALGFAIIRVRKSRDEPAQLRLSL